MSAKAIDLVRAGLKGLSEGDVEAPLRYMAPDVVIYPFPEWMEEPRYDGHDGWRELLAGWTESFDEFAPVVDELREVSADTIVAFGWNTGRIKGTTVPIKQPVGAVFRVDEHLIREVKFFMTWNEALAEARA